MPEMPIEAGIPSLSIRAAATTACGPAAPRRGGSTRVTEPDLWNLRAEHAPHGVGSQWVPKHDGPNGIIDQAFARGPRSPHNQA